ncbi:MAG: phytanoyl-CoA dioxygenase family protein [Planctomycetes bacterium]|nr:phytanoyl-CoA dioxygenase family protein [Planctomycetota bacterium]
MFTARDKAFFDTFGYLVCPGLVADSIDWIIAGFEENFRSRNVAHDGTKRTMFPESFIDSNERLCTLLDHPGVLAVGELVMGKDFNYAGGDGNLYAGDTGWHSDLIPPTPEGIALKLGVLNVKIAFYLDPVTKDTGALRVIPGSHRIDDSYGRLLHEQVMNSKETLGIDGRDVPCVALESKPGDVVVFNHLLKHAAYGGDKRRRMFTMNCFEYCDTPEKRKMNADIFAFYGGEGAEKLFSETMLRTASPARRRHLDHALEFQPGMAAVARARLVGG